MSELSRLLFLANIVENTDEKSKNFVVKNLTNKTLENSSFREVVKTLGKIQIVTMSIPVGGKIAKEVHKDGDQLLLVMDGAAKATVDNQEEVAYSGDCIAIPQGAVHEVKNNSDKELKLLVFYAPPEH